MSIIREYRTIPERGIIFILRTNGPSQNYADAVRLFRRAQKDFPSVKESELKIKQYGPTIQQGMGLELFRMIADIPEGYEEIGDALL